MAVHFYTFAWMILNAVFPGRQQAEVTQLACFVPVLAATWKNKITYLIFVFYLNLCLMRKRHLIKWRTILGARGRKLSHVFTIHPISSLSNQHVKDNKDKTVKRKKSCKNSDKNTQKHLGSSSGAFKWDQSRGASCVYRNVLYIHVTSKS